VFKKKILKKIFPFTQNETRLGWNNCVSKCFCVSEQSPNIIRIINCTRRSCNRHGRCQTCIQECHDKIWRKRDELLA